MRPTTALPTLPLLVLAVGCLPALQGTPDDGPDDDDDAADDDDSEEPTPSGPEHWFEVSTAEGDSLLEAAVALWRPTTDHPEGARLLVAGGGDFDCASLRAYDTSVEEAAASLPDDRPGYLAELEAAWASAGGSGTVAGVFISYLADLREQPLPVDNDLSVIARLDELSDGSITTARRSDQHLDGDLLTVDEDIVMGWVRTGFEDGQRDLRFRAERCE